MSTKIAIIGAGHVGAHVARALAEGETAEEIVLIDKLQEKAIAQAMDISDAMCFPVKNVRVRSGCYADCENADITIAAIGKPREKGQTRLDLLGDSVCMAQELAGQLGRKGLKGLLISITNPCDIIADCLRKQLKMDRLRAFGTGTLLDTIRLIRILSEQTGADARDVHAMVLGEHGDSSMIPCSAIRIGSLSAYDLSGFDPDTALIKTRRGGMDIIEGKGSTEYGIGQVTAFLCRMILEDRKCILPLSVHLEGEYGLKGINCGVPCIIGRSGIESIQQIPLTAAEQKALQASAEVLKKYTRIADDMMNEISARQSTYEGKQDENYKT